MSKILRVNVTTDEVMYSVSDSCACVKNNTAGVLYVSANSITDTTADDVLPIAAGESSVLLDLVDTLYIKGTATGEAVAVISDLAENFFKPAPVQSSGSGGGTPSITVDNEPIDGSINPVASGGVYSALQDYLKTSGGDIDAEATYNVTESLTFASAENTVTMHDIGTETNKPIFAENTTYEGELKANELVNYRYLKENINAFVVLGVAGAKKNLLLNNKFAFQSFTSSNLDGSFAQTEEPSNPYPLLDRWHISQYNRGVVLEYRLNSNQFGIFTKNFQINVLTDGLEALDFTQYIYPETLNIPRYSEADVLLGFRFELATNDNAEIADVTLILEGDDIGTIELIEGTVPYTPNQLIFDGVMEETENPGYYELYANVPLGMLDRLRVRFRVNFSSCLGGSIIYPLSAEMFFASDNTELNYVTDYNISEDIQACSKFYPLIGNNSISVMEYFPRFGFVPSFLSFYPDLLMGSQAPLVAYNPNVY